MQTFRTKYNGLPGDLNSTDATAFGFTQRGGGPGHGDGDGMLEYCDVTVSTSSYLGCEPVLFWHDFSDAGLIEGSYMATDAPVTITAGQATIFTFPMPRSAFRRRSSRFPCLLLSRCPPLACSRLPIPAASALSVILSPECIMASAVSPPVHLQQCTRNVGLTPLEAFAIDSKIDDGFPMTGNVYGGNVTLSVCGEAALPWRYSPRQRIPTYALPGIHSPLRQQFCTPSIPI